jgi:hypothetical protein
VHCVLWRGDGTGEHVQAAPVKGAHGALQSAGEAVALMQLLQCRLQLC